MNLYKNIETIFTYKSWILNLNFSSFSEKLDIYTLSEIISFALSEFWHNKIESISILWEFNFFNEVKLIKQILWDLFWIKDLRKILPDEIQIYSSKNEFYSSWDKILKTLWEIWLSDDTSYLLFSSLWEIIDNSFFHNLWRWKTNFWPKCFFYYNHDKKNKKLSFIVSDLWTWFKESLRNNFKDLKTEKEALEISLKPWITWRYCKKWWNWLVFLQKNIFNWFNWELFIRSNTFLAKIDWFGKVVEIENNIKILWSMVKFNLFY